MDPNDLRDCVKREIKKLIEPVAVVEGGGSAKTMHYAEADRVMIEHRLEHAAHGAFLTPDLVPDRLLVPEVTAIGLRNAVGVFARIGPG
jgi:hypothetical protein